MIAEVTMYRVACDRCGRAAEGSDYYAWAHPNDAEEMWRDECGGEVVGGYLLCSQCWTWGPDGEEIEAVPGPFVWPGVIRR